MRSSFRGHLFRARAEVSLVLWCALTACDSDGKKGALASVPRERSEAVVAAADTPRPAPSTSPPAPSGAPAGARSGALRKLCEGELGKPSELPKRSPSPKAASE